MDLRLLIFLVLMAEAFMGYVLPWGNMSFWGAQVITSLFGSLPVIGGSLVEWIRGDYVIADATLNRFFALHVAALPLALMFLVVAAPDGAARGRLEQSRRHRDQRDTTDAHGHPLDGMPFHPYYTVKDFDRRHVLPGDFRRRDLLRARRSADCSSKAPNFEPANPLPTPPHIAPAWYFTPFYAMLRAVPSFWGTQVWGVLVMGASIVILFFVPWLDRSPVKSIRYRAGHLKIMLAVFVVSFIVLGHLRPEAAGGHLPDAGQDLHRPVFRFFPADAVVHALRQRQARAGEGHES